VALVSTIAATSILHQFILTPMLGVALIIQLGLDHSWLERSITTVQLQGPTALAWQMDSKT